MAAPARQAPDALTPADADAPGADGPALPSVARDAHAAQTAALLADLRARPEAYEFFEALRRLECAHPDRPRLGHSLRARDDAVRLRHTPSLNFAPRSVDRFEPGKGAAPSRLNGFFLGLFGPNGPLPLHLTEYALDRSRNAKDPTFVAFADVFHHRMLSLFYRAWADSQPTVQADRPESDRFGLYVGALFGLGSPGVRDRDAFPDDAKRYFAGRLVPAARNAEGLTTLLEQFFRVPVRVIEFVADWLRLPEPSYLRLGHSRSVAGLGQTSVIGKFVRGSQHRFRLRLGPLARSEFDHFMPGGVALRQLVAAVRSYVGDELSWDLQLVLKKAEVPAVKLGMAGRLGLSAWMAPGVPANDADEVILCPAA